jgi:hypothetical protein
MTNATQTMKIGVQNAKTQFVDTPLNELLSAHDTRVRQAGPTRVNVSLEDAGAVSIVHNVKTALADAATFVLPPVTASERGDVPWKRIRDDMWLLNRVVYKGSNQHRTAKFFDAVQRAVRLQRHLWRPAHLDDVLRAAFAVLPNRAKQRADNPALFNLQVHATVAILIIVVLKLLIVRDEISAALSALRATRVPLQTQLALGFFAPLALTCISACARIHSECLIFRSRIDELVTQLLRVGTLAFGAEFVLPAVNYETTSTNVNIARTAFVYEAFRVRLTRLILKPQQQKQQQQQLTNTITATEIEPTAVEEDIGESIVAQDTPAELGPALRVSKKPKKRKTDELDDIFAALDRR